MHETDPQGDSNGQAGDSEAKVIHDFKAMREGLGISQRELAKRSQIPQAILSRIEAGERGASLEETVKITTALGAKLEDQPVYREAVKAHQAKPGIRRAFVCRTCRRRTYLTAGEPAAFVPECQEHGPMVRQVNMPYMGQSTEPTDEQGWPEAKDGVEQREEAWAKWVRRNPGAAVGRK